ncbi:MAG TPA: carboxypeptidase regulatory-like domain-containing protein [Anaerolineales bacterium]|nr:carboxypeptidase regulatory-like domain-containing protein [Anaerolineales bacterium]
MSVTIASKKIASIFLLACLVFSGAGTRASQASPPAQSAEPPLQVSYALEHDLSPALRDLVPKQSLQFQGAVVQPPQPLPKAARAPGNQTPQVDAALQDLPALAEMPGTDFNFEGINNINGVLPPDTNGDIGPNHYVQWVNLSMAIWTVNRNTHTATLVYGPSPGNAIWNGFGGPCQSNNDGDPIVLYDHLANRWFISQFAINYPSGPFYQCIAISQTPDPTGAWYRYAFLFSETKMNDYPKFGVWPDGYYLSVNQFENSGWAGAGVAVYEREKMLAGLPARQLYFDLYDVNISFGGMLPADLDGPPPPPGTPNYFAEMDDGSWIPPTDAIRIWEFHVDWANTANSSFGLSGNPNALLPVENFTPLCTATRSCIPQKDTSRRLDDLSDRLMHRLQYRYFDTYATLVTNHTVNVGLSRAGLRWYELRRVAGTWNIYQQGTYAGDGGNFEHRWMGSAAMDGMGNIAIGYSLSSSTVHPSIAYTGRLAGDPLNTLIQGEAYLIVGAGSQTSTSARWGDYSMLSVDPSDECTFWYTNQYLQTSGNSPWRTRIGSFVFPACLSPQKGTLQGMVSSSSDPIPNAAVQADGFTTYTDASGFYQFSDIPTGTYDLTVSAYGYQPATANGVVVALNATTVQDFNLDPIPRVNVSGTVNDGSGQGWPLYARLHITAPGLSTILFTNPVSGAYTIDLAEGIEHSFAVEAVSPGYLPASRTVTPAPPAAIEDFSLLVNTSTCTAPGYEDTGTCSLLSGGLLTGNVYDANTGQPVNGATVTSIVAPGDTTSSFPTPEDPANEDGFYLLFSSQTGEHDYTATKVNYGIDTQTASISLGGVASVSFNIPAGRLSSNPGSLAENLEPSEVVTRTVTLNNTGTLGASFEIIEVEAAWQALTPSGPFAAPTRHTSPKHLADLDAAAVYDYNPPVAASLPGGEVHSRWPSRLEHIWGLGYDTSTDRLWAGNLAAGGGDDRLYRFNTDGSPSAETIETASTGAYFAADLSYNPFTRTFWQVTVGGSAANCLVEIDPSSRRLTGQQICPAFNNPQRGLAYNPLNNSFYSGAWTDGILYHFDSKGTILASTDTGLNIAGLAFNPDTQHLFVLSNADQGLDVYVLDVNANYALLGGFDIPGLGDFQQAGLSLACDGHLWLANQGNQEILEVESGERHACLFAEVAWLSAAPTSGSISAGGSQDIAVRIDARGVAAGQHPVHLLVNSDTPYGPLSLPVTLTIDPVYLYLPGLYR